LENLHGDSTHQEVYTAVGTAVHKVAELYKKPEEVQAMLRICGPRLLGIEMSPVYGR
jgi:4-hydroxy-3-methylbut-2-enyl diphosphate reductase IspH